VVINCSHRWGDEATSIAWGNHLVDMRRVGGVNHDRRFYNPSITYIEMITYDLGLMQRLQTGSSTYESFVVWDN
jgi:hypothetical protein